MRLVPWSSVCCLALSVLAAVLPAADDGPVYTDPAQADAEAKSRIRDFLEKRAGKVGK